MADTILLNNETYHLNEDSLPCLIHYAPQTGCSHFTAVMVELKKKARNKKS